MLHDIEGGLGYCKATMAVNPSVACDMWSMVNLGGNAKAMETYPEVPPDIVVFISIIIIIVANIVRFQIGVAGEAEPLCTVVLLIGLSQCGRCETRGRCRSCPLSSIGRA